MTLIKWNPAKNILANNWNQYLDSFFNDDFFDSSASINQPAVNVVESEKNYRLDLAVPGYQKEDFNVDVDGNLLTLSAQSKKEEKEEKENYTRREFSFSSFKRTFTLPENVDAQQIKATYQNGILEINLPKIEEKKKESKTKISIN